MLEGLILGFAGGLIVSYIYVKFVIWHTLRQLEQQDIRVNEIIDKMKTRIEQNMIAARMEEHQGRFYLYRADNNEFIAQGATAEEVDAHTDRRFGKKTVIVTDAEPTTLARYLSTKTPQSS